VISSRRVPLGLLAAAVLSAATAFPAGTAARAAAPRIVAVGDIHGNAEGFDAILRQAGLLDARGGWTGGRAILVQTGDITDRGAGVRAVMDRLMSLERPAAAAGGRVHVLLGNHEVMNLFGDLRDVSPDVFATFADAKSEATRSRAHAAYKRYLAERAKTGGGAGLPSAQEWLRLHPPGFIEYREAFDRNGRYGRWLRAKDAALQLGDVVFLHGGLNPDVSPPKLAHVNAQVRREIRMWDDAMRSMTDRRLVLPFFTITTIVDAAVGELQRTAKLLEPDVLARQGLPVGLDETLIGRLQALARIATWSVMRADGPLWFRGLATWSDEDGSPQVAKLLQRYGASRVVVGHTPTASMRITPRFQGQVFLIDTGILGGRYYPAGRPSALEFEDGRATAVYLDGRTVLLEP
jgi:3',5'-cyclic AMP phosphodiesterase CpdA